MGYRGLGQGLGDDTALDLSMHDLRRTWATDTFYSLAFGGVPIAEDLTMSWGGWEKTSTGRETFHRDYLGPVPDHITERSVEHLERLICTLGAASRPPSVAPSRWPRC